MSEYWEGWGRFFVIGVMFVYVSRAILDCISDVGQQNPGDRRTYSFVQRTQLSKCITRFPWSRLTAKSAAVL